MTTTVEVELEDFSTREIISELEYRVARKLIQNGDKKKLKDIIIDNEKTTSVVLSLIDQMKVDFLFENIDKISLEKLEGLINKIKK